MPSDPEMSPRVRVFARFGHRTGVILAACLVGAAAGGAGAAPVAQPLQTPACDVWTADYTLAARLRLADTPFGAGDGVFDTGPGHLQLRFSKTADSSATKVELLKYEMRDRFVVDSSVLFFHAKVTTSSETRATPDQRGVIATGTLRGRELAWSTKVSGYRTDGTIDCKGSGCGMSGVPPSGSSPLHIGPNAVEFSPFKFDSSNLSTLRMAETKVAHTAMPRQTAFITFSGRQTSNQCDGSR